MLKMQAFLRNGDQQVGGNSNPDLRLDGVLAGAKERLDAQVLLDPFEEQFPSQRWRHKWAINSIEC
jgi:hypothetical protein